MFVHVLILTKCAEITPTSLNPALNISHVSPWMVEFCVFLKVFFFSKFLREKLMSPMCECVAEAPAQTNS
jgi:hypothetical protein